MFTFIEEYYQRFEGKNFMKKYFAVGLLFSLLIVVGCGSSSSGGDGAKIGITTDTLHTGYKNSSYEITIEAFGGSGSYSFAAETLPTGLTIDADSGVISGVIASDPAVYTCAITATDKNYLENKVTRNYEFNVDAPQASTGGVSGNAVDALVVDGTVTAYVWADGTQGVQIGQTTTGANGDYILDIQIDNTPILLVVEGGWYVEESSGERVSLRDGQKMYAVTNYEQGDSVSVMLTPMTSLAYGLAQYLVSKDENVQNAISSANSAISGMVNFDILTVCPANITGIGNDSPIITEELMAGFYCAAFSSWSEELSIANSLAVHSYYNSIYLATIMYNDIRYDGQLDGIGFSSSGLTAVPLSIGSQILDSQIYRQQIGKHVIKAANGEYNKTLLKVDDIVGSAKEFSQQVLPIFGNDAPLPLDAIGPIVERATAVGTSFSKIISYQFLVTDECGISSVTAILNGVDLIASAGQNNKYTININTTAYPDAEHTLEITAIDNLQNSSTIEHKLIFNNSGVDVGVGDDTGDTGGTGGIDDVGVSTGIITNKTEYLLSGVFGDSGTNLVSITIEGNGETINADIDTGAKKWSSEVSLKNGLNTFVIKATDDINNIQTLPCEIYLDQNLPSITTVAHSNATFLTAAGHLKSQLEDKNTGDPLYIDLKNVSLGGVSPSNKTALDNAKIPYFCFSVDDPADNGVFTAANELKTTMSFSVGITELVTDRVLTPIAGSSSEFIIPLTLETLHDSWDQTKDNQENKIKITCIDNAGNMIEREYTFKVYIQSPVITMHSLNSGSDVTLYTFETGTKGGLIQTSKTDSSGFAEVNVFTEPKLMLSRLTNGSFKETGTGSSVSMAETQYLDCLFLYDGEDMEITITPLTHIAACLALKKIADGVNPTTAVQDANDKISALYGLDIINSYPVDINNVSNATSLMTDNYKYAFVLAGMSQWTKKAAEENGSSQSIYNSILLSEKMGDDIYLDGLLDGDSNFGDVPLGPNVYRNELAYGMFNVVNSNLNKTTLEVDETLPLMIFVAENEDGIYDGVPVTKFDTEGPELFADGFVNNEFFSGDATLNFTATDTVGVDSVALYIGDTLIDTAASTSNPSFIVDTKEYIDGNLILEVRAVDLMGTESSTNFTIIVDNTDPVLSITSPGITNNINFTVTGSVVDTGVGVQSLSIQGHPATIAENGTFSVNVPLTVAAGSNILNTIIIDNKNKEFTGTIEVKIDIQPAIMEASSSYNSSGRFYSSPHAANIGDIGSNNTVPFYVEYWKTALNGIPIEINNLSNAGYMYFRIRYSDPNTGNGIFTPADAIKVEMQYLQGSDIIDNWHEIPAQITAASTWGNIVIPIVDEVFNPSWKTVGSSVKQTINLRTTDAAGNVGTKTLSFYALVEPFEITSPINTKLEDNIAGLAYNKTITASGGVAPYNFTVLSGTLPCDLSLSTSGVISGNGSATWCSKDAYTFTVRATDANAQSVNKTYTITFIEPVVIGTLADLGEFKNNLSVSKTISASGGSGNYDITIESGQGNIPPGLTYSAGSTNATITGVVVAGASLENPANYGVKTLELKVTDKTNTNNFATKTFNFNVVPDLASGIPSHLYGHKAVFYKISPAQTYWQWEDVPGLQANNSGHVTEVVNGGYRYVRQAFIGRVNWTRDILATPTPHDKYELERIKL